MTLIQEPAQLQIADPAEQVMPEAPIEAELGQTALAGQVEAPTVRTNHVAGAQVTAMRSSNDAFARAHWQRKQR